MQPTLSTTQLFYDFLDLEPAAQHAFLQQLQQQQPEQYQALLPFLEHGSESQIFTQLLGANRQQLVAQQLDLSQVHLGKYQLTDELGRGGLGVVYAAKRDDGTFEQDIAVKFIQADLTKILGEAALFKEAQLLAKLNHPSIAKVFDGGSYQQSVYIVMERVFGQTLDQYLTLHTLSRPEKLKLFQKICFAMEHAHQQGVIHADLKPENIMVEADQNPKLFDFNLTQQTDITELNLAAFSPEYASPEQINGQALSPSCDIYALGKLFAFLFPAAQQDFEIKMMINKATQVEPEQRYSSAQLMAVDIQQLLENRPLFIKKNAPIYGMRKLLARRPQACALATVLVLSGLFFNQTLLAKNQQLAVERNIAQGITYEITHLLFQAQQPQFDKMSANDMLEFTRKRLLADPHLPTHLKQQLIFAMIHSAKKHNPEQSQDALDAPTQASPSQPLK